MTGWKIVPFDVTSTGNNLFLRFESDSSVGAYGFFADIHFVMPSTTTTTTTTTPFSIMENQIMSPNYPNPYPNNYFEYWELTAPEGLIIKLQFHTFHVSMCLCMSVIKAMYKICPLGSLN